MMEFKATPRPSPIAGTWYSGEPQTLSRQIDSYIKDAKVTEEDVRGKVIGLVAPHAGHRYSGKTAGYAYKMLKDKERDVVIVLSPFHPFFQGDLITTHHHSYRTPLGEVEVDTDSLAALDSALTKKEIRIHQISKDTEHSLEIQLPFLQRALMNEFKLLPLMVRSHNLNLLKDTSDEVYAIVKRRNFVVIASTDLSHFYPLDIAEVMDAEMLKHIKNMDPESVLAAERDGSASACGAPAIAMMLWIARKARAENAYILNYSTSADATGDTTSVVGYGSVAVTL
jgi:AmmeMemoRadiSam system protein B